MTVSTGCHRQIKKSKMHARPVRTRVNNNNSPMKSSGNLGWVNRTSWSREADPYGPSPSKPEAGSISVQFSWGGVPAVEGGPLLAEWLDEVEVDEAVDSGRSAELGAEWGGEARAAAAFGIEVGFAFLPGFKFLWFDSSSSTRGDGRTMKG